MAKRHDPGPMGPFNQPDAGAPGFPDPREGV